MDPPDRRRLTAVPLGPYQAVLPRSSVRFLHEDSLVLAYTVATPPG